MGKNLKAGLLFLGLVFVGTMVLYTIVATIKVTHAKSELSEVKAQYPEAFKRNK